MKKSIKRCGIHIYLGQFVLAAVLSACWWGILYPNFSMTEETFQAVAQDEEDEAGGRAGAAGDGRGQKGAVISGAEGFFAMLDAGPDEIEIKSRFMEVITGIRGNENE